MFMTHRRKREAWRSRTGFLLCQSHLRARLQGQRQRHPRLLERAQQHVSTFQAGILCSRDPALAPAPVSERERPSLCDAVSHSGPERESPSVSLSGDSNWYSAKKALRSTLVSSAAGRRDATGSPFAFSKQHKSRVQGQGCDGPKAQELAPRYRQPGTGNQVQARLHGLNTRLITELTETSGWSWEGRHAGRDGVAKHLFTPIQRGQTVSIQPTRARGLRARAKPSGLSSPSKDAPRQVCLASNKAHQH